MARHECDQPSAARLFEMRWPQAAGRALLACARGMGEKVPDEGNVRVLFDDSIIQDTEAEKERDMKEVAAGLMQAWEYRVRWYGESEETARRNCAQGLTA